MHFDLLMQVAATEAVFAVVCGYDHHSFPSAIHETLRLGIGDVFHYPHPRRRDDPKRGDGELVLRHIDLDRIQQPMSTSDYGCWPQLDAEGICHELPLPFNFGPVTFRSLSHFPNYMLSPAGYTKFASESLRAMSADPSTPPIAFFPDFKANWISSTSGTEEIRWTEFQRPFQAGRQCPIPAMRPLPGILYLASPGHCRAHSFCICNLKEGEVTWYSCA